MHIENVVSHKRQIEQQVGVIPSVTGPKMPVLRPCLLTRKMALKPGTVLVIIELTKFAVLLQFRCGSG